MKSANEMLDKILEKPESTRKKIAAISVVLFMTVILSIWWSTFSIKTTASITENTNATTASPFDIAWNSIKNTVRLNPIFK